MARKVRIVSARDFVSAKPDGTLNLEESEQLLREVVGISDPLSDEFDILVDTREAVSVLSATDLWFLADRLLRHPQTFAGRTAILCPSERFDSYEEAMAWLQAPR